MVTVDDVRRLALALPRTEEHLVRDRVKFRIGRIVYLALSRDETGLGFAFPKEERAALVAAEPEKFLLPGAGDLRYHWVEARMAALGVAELAELVTDAWRMCVPAKVARAHLEGGAEVGLPPAPGLESGGPDEAALAAELGRPGLPLAKLLDEYLYVTITHQGS
ncbi:MmcQ/YjbR family DNA-binding protein [Streptomyces sp. NPDC058157]|uniref:MmcQ/YjbR family DNA-binding protein n=1 Tax=Streptomyces sp. NPDC058157 TaxID=3346360 RepID=UPI0036E70201